jgi:hypothetical protein
MSSRTSPRSPLRSRHAMHRSLTRKCLLAALVSLLVLVAHPSPALACGAVLTLAASLYVLFAADTLAGYGSPRDRARHSQQRSRRSSWTSSRSVW